MPRRQPRTQHRNNWHQHRLGPPLKDSQVREEAEVEDRTAPHPSPTIAAVVVPGRAVIWSRHQGKDEGMFKFKFLLAPGVGKGGNKKTKHN